MVGQYKRLCKILSAVFRAAKCPPHVTRRNREVVDFKRYRVKNNTELTNLMKMYRIQGYNGKYGSNPQEFRNFQEIFYNLVKSDKKLIVEIGENGILRK